MLEQCCNHSKQCRNNVVMLCCTKHCHCESSPVTTSPLKRLCHGCLVHFVKIANYLFLERFPKVRKGRQNHSRTSHFDDKKCFFPRVFVETLSPSCVLFRIWLIWLDSLIKSKILIMTGMVWPVSSDKWEAPLVSIELTVGKKKKNTASCQTNLLVPQALYW